MRLPAKNVLVGVLALAAYAAFASVARADALKCQRGILKESGKFA